MHFNQASKYKEALYSLEKPEGGEAIDNKDPRTERNEWSKIFDEVGETYC